MFVNTVVLAAKLIMVCEEVDMNTRFCPRVPETPCLEKSGVRSCSDTGVGTVMRCVITFRLWLGNSIESLAHQIKRSQTPHQLSIKKKK